MAEQGQEPQQQPKKGEYLGECNRTCCDNKQAKYFNKSTEMYYCIECAELINSVNYSDSIRLYGTALCVLDQPKIVTFSCSNSVHVYTGKSSVLPMSPYNSHANIDDAKNALITRGIENPKIIFQ